MAEEKLQHFINENPESYKLEYKLKPNFSEIKEVMKHIDKRMEWMHFNILKTIYAFANTKGGDLYLGIDEDDKGEKRTVVGLADYDLKLIKNVIKKVTQTITKNMEIIPLKEEKRSVVKITVKELDSYDKPQILDGVLYVRRNDQNYPIQSFEKSLGMYKKEQFYLFLLKGIEKNIHDMVNTQDTFMIKQFFDGLKYHIKQFARGYQITDVQLIQKAEDILNEIQKAIEVSKSAKTKLLLDIPDISVQKKLNIDKSIDDFIKMYKIIVRMGV